jgi:hypothetical protein
MKCRFLFNLRNTSNPISMMKKFFSITLLLFVFSSLTSQNLEFFGGMNRNRYYDLEKEDPHRRSEYFPDYGYSLGICVSGIETNILPVKFSLVFDHFNGGFNIRTGGLGSSSSTEAEVKKSTLGLAFYPVNLTFWKHLQFSLGGLLSFRIAEKTSGEKHSWTMGSAPVTISLDDYPENIHRSIVFGLSGSLSYDIAIHEKWFVSPQLKMYLGLSKEFWHIEMGIHSFRPEFDIAVIRRIK